MLLVWFAYSIFPLDMFVVAAGAIALSFAAHVHVHTQYHLTASWLGRFRWFRHKRELHFVHHRETGANFAVLEFAVDRLMGTYRDARKDNPASNCGDPIATAR